MERNDLRKRPVLQRGTLLDVNVVKRLCTGRERRWLTSVAIFVNICIHLCDDITLGFSTRLQRPITFPVLQENLHTSFVLFFVTRIIPT